MIEVLVTAAVLCNNFNLSSSPCNAPPEWFEYNEQGELHGELQSGVPFSQTNIVNDYTKLQKFVMQDAMWYISDKGEIYAETDLQALSIYLSL
jgi:hypothetical protein